MKATLSSLLAALLLSTVLAPPAIAADEWCDTDPLLVIRTPGGSLVPVYVNTGARGVEHLVAAQTARLAYSASTIPGTTATKVKLTVLVSPDVFGSSFETRAGVSTGPFQTGTVFATGSGHSGDPMNLQFALPIP